MTLTRNAKNLARKAIGVNNDTDFYAQGGEDAIVSNIFNYVIPTQRGFYVDVGAYHPFKHSNTYLLYKAGWRGMNIDPRPGSKVLFDKHRPGDINLEGGIASLDGSLTYYIVGEDSTMNTFSRENLERLGMLDEVIRTIEVPVYSLGSLILKHPEITKIDYLNIDAEGYESEILAGMDSWRIQPIVISLEQNGAFTLSDVLASETYTFMSARGYTPVAKNIILREVATVFYVRDEIRENVG